jgi:zinc and cadmium transporter
MLGSIGAVLTAAIFLRIQEKIQNFLIPCLISFASGTLLTAALLGLIPHAINYSNLRTILSTVLVGIILFFILEKLVIWRHCHELKCESHTGTGPMILIGDAFHNAADGLVIASSFLVSIPIGIAAAISVIAHEIPQEVGDFAILIHDGYSKRRALILNTLSSLSTVPVAILAFYALEITSAAIPYVMAISAASFVYIALTDLYPELHHKFGFQHNIRQFLMMLAGIGTILFLLQFHP